MLFNVLLRFIERGNCKDKKEMKEKLAVLYLTEQLTKDEYEKLIQLLK